MNLSKEITERVKEGEKKDHFNKAHEDEERKEEEKIAQKFLPIARAKGKAECAPKGDTRGKEQKSVEKEMDGKIQDNGDYRPGDGIDRKKYGKDPAEGVGAIQKDEHGKRQERGVQSSYKYENQEKRAPRRSFEEDEKDISVRIAYAVQKTVALLEVEFVKCRRLNKYYATHSTTQNRQNQKDHPPFS